MWCGEATTPLSLHHWGQTLSKPFSLLLFTSLVARAATAAVRTNGDLTAEHKSWGRVKFADTTKVGLSEDGTEIVIPVPANAQQGFMILESKATEK